MTISTEEPTINLMIDAVAKNGSLARQIYDTTVVGGG